MNGLWMRSMLIEMATVEEVFDELNYPSSSKLRRVLDSRGIAYSKASQARSGEASTGASVQI